MEVKRGFEEEFGAHVVETVFLQGLFNANEIAGKVLKFFLKRGSVLFLEPVQLHAFDLVDLGPEVAVPMKKGGFGDLEFIGDFGETPTVGAEDGEIGFLFGGVHKILVFWFYLSKGGRTTAVLGVDLIAHW